MPFTGEDLLQMLQKLTPEQRVNEVQVQVPAGEYDSYFTPVYAAALLKIKDCQEFEDGETKICLSVET